MFSFSEIIKDAYAITKRYPLLWLFGIFVIGTFNLNFLSFLNWPAGLSHRMDIRQLSFYFQQHPGRLAILSFSILWISLLSLVLTNWSRLMLLLITKAVLENKHYELKKEARDSRGLLWPVIKISILTSVFMLAVVAVLAAPLAVDDVALQNALWGLGLAIFFPLAFTISCLNIFITMNVVVLKLSFKKSLAAGTDFFLANWSEVLGLSFLLIAIYFAGFASGLGILAVIKLALRFGLIALSDWGFLQFSAVFIIIKTLGAALFWILLGALNVFFNTALLLFFLKKITPVKGEEKLRVPEIAPSHASS
jgi:hypothetical protein